MRPVKLGFHLKGKAYNVTPECIGFAHDVKSLSIMQVMDLMNKSALGRGWIMPSQTIIKRRASWDNKLTR